MVLGMGVVSGQGWGMGAIVYFWPDGIHPVNKYSLESGGCFDKIVK